MDPGGGSASGEATHCAAHRKEGFALQEGFSLKDGFLLQNGVVVHNTYRGSTAYRNKVSKNANDGGGSAGSSSGGDSVPARSSRGGKQARGGRGRGRGVGASRARRWGSSTCQFPGCAKPATHGDGSTPTRCAGHKEKGQIDHKHRLCENVGPQPCVKQPSFGWPGESRKRFCGAHRKPGTVDLRNCEHEGCGTRASHGFGKGKARFCAAHSLPGTNVVANKVKRGPAGRGEAGGGRGREERTLVSLQKRFGSRACAPRASWSTPIPTTLHDINTDTLFNLLMTARATLLWKPDVRSSLSSITSYVLKFHRFHLLFSLLVRFANETT